MSLKVCLILKNLFKKKKKTIRLVKKIESAFKGKQKMVKTHF